MHMYTHISRRTVDVLCWLYGRGNEKEPQVFALEKCIAPYIASVVGVCVDIGGISRYSPFTTDKMLPGGSEPRQRSARQ